jgi:hypothetical protein
MRGFGWRASTQSLTNAERDLWARSASAFQVSSVVWSRRICSTWDLGTRSPVIWGVSLPAAVGGGRNNSASANYSTVAGGQMNTASNSHSTVAGGDTNTASGFRSTVGGGYANTAVAEADTVGGGTGNMANGSSSTVAGGFNNIASGGGLHSPGGLRQRRQRCLQLRRRPPGKGGPQRLLRVGRQPDC